MTKEAMILAALEALEKLKCNAKYSQDCAACEATLLLRQAIAEAEKQEQDEPVAYIHRNEYNEYRLEPHDNFDIKSIPFNVDVPLFKATQPSQKPWVGLTDDEIDAEAVKEEQAYGFSQGALWAEAKLKEKNT